MVAILKHRSSASNSRRSVLSSGSVTTTTMHASPTPRGTPARRGRSPRASTASPGAPAIPVDIPNRPPATFTSCLSIAVEGTTPIDRPDTSAPSTSVIEASHHSGPESRRAQRKSKTDAIAALHHHAQSNSDDATESVTEEGAIRINLREGPPIRVSSILEPSTVKTPNRGLNVPNATDRPFGLTDCPVFHPTPEQWKDPLGYIKSISDNARKYGMCKIVPPAGWDMPFVTDTEVSILAKMAARAVVHTLATALSVQDALATSQFY